MKITRLPEIIEVENTAIPILVVRYMKYSELKCRNAKTYVHMVILYTLYIDVADMAPGRAVKDAQFIADVIRAMETHHCRSQSPDGERACLQGSCMHWVDTLGPFHIKDRLHRVHKCCCCYKELPVREPSLRFRKH